MSPYGNYIVTKQITGEELIEVLEISIQIQSECIEAYESGDDSAWSASSGSYLQTGSGTAAVVLLSLISAAELCAFGIRRHL